jgi:hypothetical protein
MPTKGFCTVAMAFQIERGSYGTVPLDGLGFIVLLWTPEEMGKGNWSVGVIADARASAEHMRYRRHRVGPPAAPWRPCPRWLSILA